MSSHLRRLRTLLEEHRARRERRACDPGLLVLLLIREAFEREAQGERKACDELVREARERGGRSDLFYREVARLCHLCPDREHSGLDWLSDAPLDPVLVAYRQVYRARTGLSAAPLPHPHPVVRLLGAEVLLWQNREAEAYPELLSLLRGRVLEEEHRHLAYLLMIDCLENLGRTEERQGWLERERRWSRAHGRTPCGEPEHPGVARANFIARARRGPGDLVGQRKVELLRKALTRPGSAVGLCHRVCRLSPTLDVLALRRLRRHKPSVLLEFCVLFRPVLPVGPLLLALEEVRAGWPYLVDWLEDREAGSYARRALENPQAEALLAPRSAELPRARAVLRATATLGPRAALQAVETEELAVPAAMACARLDLKRASGPIGRRLESAAAGDAPWLALSLWWLSRGNFPRLPWELAFRPDPSSGTQRDLSHPIEEYLRGYTPLELCDLEPGVRMPARRWLHLLDARVRPPARVPPEASQEIREWSGAGVRSLHELHDILEELDRGDRPPPTRHLPGGIPGLRLLALAVRRRLLAAL
ncbi:MAG: hypothetical protein HY319_06100 [Armatimonadetes bacterium]|nr:hypothetical protein [Armatimonadota bacterium]